MKTLSVRQREEGSSALELRVCTVFDCKCHQRGVRMAATPVTGVQVEVSGVTQEPEGAASGGTARRAVFSALCLLTPKLTCITQAGGCQQQVPRSAPPSSPRRRRAGGGGPGAVPGFGSVRTAAGPCGAVLGFNPSALEDMEQSFNEREAIRWIGENW